MREISFSAQIELNNLKGLPQSVTDQIVDPTRYCRTPYAVAH